MKDLKDIPEQLKALLEQQGIDPEKLDNLKIVKLSMEEMDAYIAKEEAFNVTISNMMLSGHNVVFPDVDRLH